jgi:hypothetical protein
VGFRDPLPYSNIQLVGTLLVVMCERGGSPIRDTSAACMCKYVYVYVGVGMGMGMGMGRSAKYVCGLSMQEISRTNFHAGLVLYQ